MYTIREIGENIKNYKGFEGEVLFDVPMKNRTSMRVGGNAALIIEPLNLASLKNALAFCDDYFILGGGSNIVVSDAGFDIPVFSLRNMKNMSLETNAADESTVILTVDSGCTWGLVHSFCIEHGLLGLTEFNGLPGTVGGAAYMNASCFGHAFNDNLLKISYLDSGIIKEYNYSKSDWSYKRSPFSSGKLKEDEKKSPVVCSVSFLMKKESPEVVKNAGEDILRKRSEKGHFKYPSAGSVFKNPEGFIAGKLIDECGLKGYSIGGAQVAPFHGNIIINTGNATQKDVFLLVNYVKEQVLKHKNILLNPEIIFTGIVQ